LSYKPENQIYLPMPMLLHVDLSASKHQLAILLLEEMGEDKYLSFLQVVPLFMGSHTTSLHNYEIDQRISKAIKRICRKVDNKTTVFHFKTKCEAKYRHMTTSMDT
jgi:hypothetical protein